MVSPTKKILLTTLLANACRVMLAIVFMVSGFVKAVDPVGFMYKIREYGAAFGAGSLSEAWMLFFALFFSAAEFVTGFFLLTGVWRKTLAVLSLLMLVIYTPLTLYIALENPVPDCGCFGDALRLTNWETFAKNLLLLPMAAVICFATHRYKRCISSANRWMAVLYILLYVIVLEGMSVLHLPVIDFRPYAIGVNLREAVQDVPSRYEVVSVYEKDGVQRSFAADALPDSTWSYIGGHSKLVSAGRPATVNDFVFIDRKTGRDASEDILADTGYVVIVAMPLLEKADESRVDKINDLYDYCRENDVAFYAVTSSADDAAALWRKRTGAEYPLYWGDDIALKTMIRANPGLVLVKDGVVVEKLNITDVPYIEEGEGPARLASSGGYVKVMRGWRFWLLLFAVPVALLLFVDMFAPSSRKEKNTDK